MTSESPILNGIISLTNKAPCAKYSKLICSNSRSIRDCNRAQQKCTGQLLSNGQSPRTSNIDIKSKRLPVLYRLLGEVQYDKYHFAI